MPQDIVRTVRRDVVTGIMKVLARGGDHDGYMIVHVEEGPVETCIVIERMHPFMGYPPEAKQYQRYRIIVEDMESVNEGP